MKKKFWSSRDQNIAIFVFSVLNYYETDAKLEVFWSPPLIYEINTFCKKKSRNYGFLPPKPSFFKKKIVKVRKRGFFSSKFVFESQKNT